MNSVTKGKLALCGVQGSPAACAIPNPGKYLEFSIEGADYYPWQEGLYVESPYKIKDGHIELPSGPGWGVEIHPDWLQRASYQMSEVS